MAGKNYKKVISDTEHFETYIEDAADVLKRIGKQYEEQEKEIKELKNKLNEYDAEVAKSETIQLMKHKIAQMHKKYYQTFYLTKEEHEEVREWMKNHNALIHKNIGSGAIGGRYSYEFCPTGIGTFPTIYCNVCRAAAMIISQGDMKKYEELLNDYDAKKEIERDI